MESTDRSKRNYLENLITNEAYKLEFYQAVRLLDLLYKKYLLALNKDFEKNAKGEIFDNDLKGIRFKSNIDPSFPASDIEEIKAPKKQNELFEIVVNFIGLAGVSGPLPAHYVQIILDLEKECESNQTFRDFLDIFNHRLIALMYQVRKKHRIGFESKEVENTVLSNYFYSLIGMGTNRLRKRLSVNDSVLINYIGLFVNRNRSIAGLEFILSDFFNVKVKSKSFIGRWQTIEEEFVTRIGRYGKNHCLGKSVLLGNRIWDQEALFKLIIGPVSADQFIDFLPIKDAKSYLPLIELTRHYSGPEYEFDYSFIVKSDELPCAVLGDSKRAMLGWTTWIPPEKGGIFDFDYLLFMEADRKEVMILHDGQKVRLGWTVWVPDIERKTRYIEVKVSSSDLKGRRAVA